MRINQIPKPSVLSVVQEKLNDASIPGAVIPFTTEEFEIAGGFEEEAYSFDDARNSAFSALED